MTPGANILTQFLLVTVLTVPGLQPLVDTGEIESLESQHAELLEKRSDVVDELKSLEAKLETLVDKIDRAKDADATIPGQRDVQTLLRRAHTLSQKLEDKQQQLRKLDDRIRQVRSSLLERLERARQVLEKQLREAPADERQQLVQQLNDLRSVQQRFDRPLPKAPDAADVRRALRFAAQADAQRPDELRAAAAELEDTRDQLTNRIDALEQRISQVRQRRQLNRQASSFRAREDLFDEASRPQIAGVDESSQSSDDTAGDSNSPPQDSQSPTSGSGSNKNSGDSGGEPTLGNGESRNDFSSGDPERTGSTDRSTDDRYASPPTADSPSSGTSGETSGSPFDSSSSGAFRTDPGQVAPDDGGDSLSESPDRLELLKREKQKLKQRADQLDKKAKELRNQAEQTEQSVQSDSE